jgi:polysaccharide chain length determinant protein (PEP-CTERM system associated)
MPEKHITLNINYYLGLAIKHRWLLIIPFCISMVAGLYLAVTLPEIYEASTLILVQPQRVPSDYVRSVVSDDIQSQINTISKQILSRSNLEAIIGKFGLFSDPKFSGMFAEELVQKMRERIDIEVDRRRQGGAFSVSFRGSNPETVMKVTNALASSFIEENLRVRETQAVGTSDFLTDELEIMRQRLEETENKLREYRRQYMGELPEQLNANLHVLERLQQQLSAKETSLRDEKDRLVMLENQIESERKLQATVSASGSDGTEAMSLEQLKAQLAALRSSYTDRHPDVIRLKARIAELEAGYKGGVTTAASGLRNGDTGNFVDGSQSGALGELIRQRAEIKADIGNIALEIARLNRQIGEYQKRVENTPRREQELLSLKRDYNNIQDSYNSLLNRKLEAELSVNMEKKQKGEQFQIVDFAVKPEKPVSPDMRKLFLLAVAAGLGLGGGIIFLLDFLNTSLKEPKDYETELGLAVLATVPKLITPGRKTLRRINGILTYCSLLVAVGLTGIFGLLILKGVDPVLKIASQYIKI